MAIIGLAGILFEGFFLIIYPLLDDGEHIAGIAASIYWAIAIPLFLGVSGVLLIVLWIGITMFRTPPPEEWDFDEESEELAS